ncbi:MAG: autotransporter-associated beta strand repeat-containing protein [Akkermansiaceae bacterium]|nr:autotransporter-associated beta strand repeat-containing protein [Akkermansiaceae bacterium]
MKACFRPSMKALAAAAAVGISAKLAAADADPTPVSVKANNSLPLDDPNSWLGGAVPDFATMAWWNGLVSSPNTANLNTEQSWGGIRVTNPAGLVTITGQRLELNLVDQPCIDLSAATANLMISAPLAVNGGAEWKVGPGRTLTVFDVSTLWGGPLAKTGPGVLSIRGRMELAGDLIVTEGRVWALTGGFISASRIQLRTPDDLTPTSPVLAISQSQTLPDLLVDQGLASATLELGGTAGRVRIGTIELLSPLIIRRAPPSFVPQPVILETERISGAVTPGTDAMIFTSVLGPGTPSSPETIWQPSGMANDFLGGNVRFAVGLWAIHADPAASHAVMPAESMLGIDASARLTWRGFGYQETFDGLAGQGAMLVAAPGSSFTIRPDNPANDGRRVFSGSADFRDAALRLDGAGTQTLAGPGIGHIGALTVVSGRLVLRDATNMASASLALHGGTLEIERTTGEWDFATPITGGAGTLVKSGAGTVTLLAPAGHSGATVIREGTLALGVGGDLPHTSAVELNGGHFQVSALQDGFRTSVLVGTGMVTGPILVDSRLAIGSSAGRIDFTDLRLTAGAMAEFEVMGGGTAGDLGNVSGRLDLGGATLSLLQTGSFTPGQKFTLFAYSLANLTGTFAGLPDGAGFAAADGEWIIRYGDPAPGVNGGTGDRFVTVTAIPEPAAALTAVLAAALCAARRRRVA